MSESQTFSDWRCPHCGSDTGRPYLFPDGELQIRCDKCNKPSRVMPTRMEGDE